MGVVGFGMPAGRRMCISTRVGILLAALLWPAALAVWLLHVAGIVRGETTTALWFTWLVAAGCLGTPVVALRLLGPWLTARACRGISLVCLGASAILTVEDAAGQLHPTTASLYASLILPMAAGINANNAKAILVKLEDAYRRGVQAGRAQEAVTLEGRAQDAFERFEALDDDALDAVIHVATMVREARRHLRSASLADTVELHTLPSLRVVSDRNGHTGSG